MRSRASPTLREAGALIHLFDVPDRLLSVRHTGMPDERVDEEFERQPGAEVEDAAAGSNHPRLPLKVALLADRLSKHRLEMLRIDDRVVDSLRRAGCFTCNSPGPWQRSQPIAWPVKMGSRKRLIVPSTGSAWFA